MDNQTMTGRKSLRPTTRRLIQLYSALLHNANLKGFIDGEIYQGKAKYACVPGFNCYSCPGAVGACPLGALQNALASTGHRAGWYVMEILLLFGLTLGRTICGWICPLGLIQELLHKIPTVKIQKNRLTRALSWLKYVVLAVFVIAIPLWYGVKHDLPLPGFCKYICPAGTLEGAVSLLSNPNNTGLFGMLGILFTRKFTIMLIIGLACVFCYRSFCRFLCPLGAIYGLFNRFCLVGVRVDKDRCNECGACVRGCGMDVRHVGDHECIHCAKCVDNCPRKAISLKAGSRVLKAPADTFTEEETVRRKKHGRIAWGIALAVLCFALLWFNFLDPAVRNKTGAGTVASVTAKGSGTSVGSEVGMQLEDFTLTCLDGTEFSLSAERGKPVFINLWATYCTPCVQELPYFAQLRSEHEDDIAMLAVHSSIVTDDPAAFLEGRGWDIPFAVDTEDDRLWNIVGGSSTLPQTIVLNREGTVIYNRKGSVTPETLAALYEQAAGGAAVAVAPAGETADGTEETAGGYTVLVTDEEGMPVPGVTVQFCSDTECVLGTTDGSGMARFDQEAGEYTIHLLVVPDGYAEDTEEYTAPAEPGTMTIVLQTAAGGGDADDDSVMDVPSFGFHYERPEKYADAKGLIDFSGGILDEGLLNINLEYYAVPPERFDEYIDYGNRYIDALMSDEELPEAPDPSWMSGRESAYLFTIFGISDGRGEDELRALLQDRNEPFHDEFSNLEEVWTDGSNTFYVGQYEYFDSKMDEFREVMGGFFPEFEELYNDRETFLSAVSFRAPIWIRDLKPGDVLRFETTDLDGNPVSSEDLFAESEVTIINLWGTWCGPCKGELPELAVMAKEFEAKGCRLVGICNDAYQEGKPEAARQLLQDAGADYLNLVGYPELDEMLQAKGYPTTFFVDSEGRLLLDPILGAAVGEYPKAVDRALSLIESGGEPEQP